MSIGLRIVLSSALLLGSVALCGCGSSSDDPAVANSSAPQSGGRAGRRRGPSPEDLHPVVLIKTSMGDITAQLDAEKAPITVDNFLNYAGRGQYAGTIFHQVDSGFILLGGGYTAEMQEKPAQAAIRNEAHNGLKNRRGALAMSRQPDVIDSSTSQFFINLADNEVLDHKVGQRQPAAFGQSDPSGKPQFTNASYTTPADNEAGEYGYCVFGQVISGQDVVDRIAQVEVRAAGAFDKLPVKPVTIQSIQRIK